MPDYKKKRVRRFGGARTPARKPQETVEMRPSREKYSAAKSDSGIRVIKGNKLARRRKLRLVLIICAAVSAVLLLLSWLLPVGLTENINNLLAIVGTGSYPQELYGAETLNSVSRGSCYYVLTDTDLSAFSNAGKRIFTRSHGFASPVLKTSETRALVFDQGGSTAMICNLKEELSTVTTEGRTILTAAISRSGAYAIVTDSDSYASVVSVYDRHGKLLYEWYSAADMVNGVTLSPSGKQLAVSTLNASGGQYNAHVLVFTYDSATPAFTADYPAQVVYSLDNASDSGFTVLTENTCSFIRWSKYTRSDYTDERGLYLYRGSKSGSLLVYNRSSDRSDNHIVLLSAKGEKTAEFDFDGIISDIVMAHGHIYCISDTTVYLLDRNGQVLRTGACGYGAVRLAVTGSYSVAVITNSDITKLTVEDEQHQSD